MQWVLQNYEDTSNLGVELERMGIAHSFHKVIPFVGELTPEPVIEDKSKVLLFGSYSLRHYARKHGLTPGVFEIDTFYHEVAWIPYLLNGPHNSTLMTVREVAALSDIMGVVNFFVRPIEDSKEIAGTVMDFNEIVDMCKKVMALPEEELIRGSLGHDTVLILGNPTHIMQEWRVWVVADQVVTYSLYKQNNRVMYLPYMDEDALHFVKEMVAANAGYSDAYVIDVCRTEDGLKILETNCINAAGLYAADLNKLIGAFENL